MALSTIGIIAGICLRLIMVFLIPLGRTVDWRLEGLNDEAAHVRYVDYLATHHAFPVQTHHVNEPGAYDRGDYEYYQPPLYYLLGAGLYVIVGRSNAVHACRLFSSLCGLATLLVMWRVFQRCNLPRTVAMPTMAFASLFLTHAYFCSLVSNDGLSWLFSALIILVLVGLGEPRRPHVSNTQSLWRAALLAGLLAAGVLTKTALAVFFPIVGMIYGCECLRLKSVRPLVEGGALLLSAALLATPWYSRNWVHYGSLFALDVGFGPESHASWGPSDVYALVAGTIRYFWFPMQHVGPSVWVRGLRIAGSIVLAGHLGAWLAYLWRKRPVAPREMYLALCVLSVLAVYVRLNLQWSEPEARFLLPAFVPMMYAMAAGLWGVVGRTRWASWGAAELLIVGMIPFAHLVGP